MKIKIMTLAAGSFLLSSCAFFDMGLSMDQMSTEKKCTKLRRQIAYNRLNNSEEASYVSKRQKERLYQLYREYGCSQYD